jgi:hypothetical protein
MIRRVAMPCTRSVWQRGAQIPKVPPGDCSRCNSCCSQLQSQVSSRCRASLALNATEFAVAMQLILGLEPVRVWLALYPVTASKVPWLRRKGNMVCPIALDSLDCD